MNVLPFDLANFEYEIHIYMFSDMSFSIKMTSFFLIRDGNKIARVLKFLSTFNFMQWSKKAK